MNIVVYLGASEGNDPVLKDRICELGSWIGESGHTLVYGGSESGLMGMAAKSVLDAGGKVIGVEPQMFVDAGYVYDRITELIITENMPVRKTKMIELGDAFIAFPGGTGTLDEISEIMVMKTLDQLDSPCIIYNIDGYYDGLKALIDKMLRKDLVSAEKISGIIFAESLDEIKSHLM